MINDLCNTKYNKKISFMKHNCLTTPNLKNGQEICKKRFIKQNYLTTLAYMVMQFVNKYHECNRKRVSIRKKYI